MDRLVTVCANCKRASCWHGEFLCDESKNVGTVEIAASELDKLCLEHPFNYSEENINREIQGLEINNA